MQTFGLEEDSPPPGNHISKVVDKLGSMTEANSSLQPTLPMVTMGTGLAALPKKLVTKILANDYIDFAELPPARGKSRPVPHALEGQVIVVQAADLIETRKIIPDLATWVQCFSLYVAVLATHSSQRVPELMAYQTTITKASLSGPHGWSMTKTLGKRQLETQPSHGQR